MIDLAELCRVQLRSGSRVHATAAPGARMTACGRTVHLYGPTGRAYDRALEPTVTITCPVCQTTGTHGREAQRVE